MAPGNSSTYIVCCPLDDLGIDIDIDIDTEWHLVTPPPTLLVAHHWMISVLIVGSCLKTQMTEGHCKAMLYQNHALLIINLSAHFFLSFPNKMDTCVTTPISHTDSQDEVFGYFQSKESGEG